MRDEREQSGGATEYDLAQQQQAPAQGQPPAQQQQAPPPQQPPAEQHPPAQEQQYQQHPPAQEQQHQQHPPAQQHQEHRGHEEHGGRSAAEVAQGERPGESTVASTSLLQPQDAQAFERRWEDVQVSFVDQPRSALQEADDLVDEVMKRISQRFADERSGLESQWGQGGEVSTEDMRVALQHYRSFFNRLLKVQEGR